VKKSRACSLGFVTRLIAQLRGADLGTVPLFGENARRLADNLSGESRILKLTAMTSGRPATTKRTGLPLPTSC
jgi:hypothetical protein